MTKETTQALEVTIEKVVYGGDGLARTAEGVVLVPGALAGERVSVELEPVQHGIRRARLIEVLTPDPARIPAHCPYFGRCGGCQHQQLDYPRQLAMKEQVLRECFERIGKFSPDVPITHVPSEPWEYRNRIRLRLRRQGDEFLLGFAEAGSHAVYPVERCPIAAPALQQVIAEFSGDESLRALWPEGSAELELFVNDTGDSLWATVESDLPAPRSFGLTLRERLPQLASVRWRGKRPAREKVWGTGSIQYSVGDYRYRVSHGAFFQANRFLLPRMPEIALDGLEGRRALDLYSGVGLFTLPLASRFEQVAAVESSPAAAADLAINIGELRSRVFVNHKPADQFLKKTSPKWDVIVADPPRHGLAGSVRKGIIRLRPRPLVYVSCDPATLARDLAAFMAASFTVRSIHLIDQFPQTYHIETIVRLEFTG